MISHVNLSPLFKYVILYIFTCIPTVATKRSLVNYSQSNLALHAFHIFTCQFFTIYDGVLISKSQRDQPPVGLIAQSGGGGVLGVLPYKGYTSMCSLKGYGFSAVLIINRVSILAIFVSNRVWFLHSSLELARYGF